MDHSDSADGRMPIVGPLSFLSPSPSPARKKPPRTEKPNHHVAPEAAALAPKGHTAAAATAAGGASSPFSMFPAPPAFKEDPNAKDEEASPYLVSDSDSDSVSAKQPTGAQSPFAQFPAPPAFKDDNKASREAAARPGSSPPSPSPPMSAPAPASAALSDGEGSPPPSSEKAAAAKSPFALFPPPPSIKNGSKAGEETGTHFGSDSDLDAGDDQRGNSQSPFSQFPPPPAFKNELKSSEEPAKQDRSISDSDAEERISQRQSLFSHFPPPPSISNGSKASDEVVSRPESPPPAAAAAAAAAPATIAVPDLRTEKAASEEVAVRNPFSFFPRPPPKKDDTSKTKENNSLTASTQSRSDTLTHAPDEHSHPPPNHHAVPRQSPPPLDALSFGTLDRSGQDSVGTDRSAVLELTPQPTDSYPPPVAAPSVPALAAHLTAIDVEPHIPFHCSPSKLLKAMPKENMMPKKQKQLPQSHIKAHQAFVKMCEDPIDHNARDWNEEFQFFKTDYIHFYTFGEHSPEKISRFLTEFETYAKKLVENFMDSIKVQGEPSQNATQIRGQEKRTFDPFPRDSNEGCVRIGNVVLRVWRDAKLGLNFQRCICAFSVCNTGRLFFPLMATFRVFHVSVSVMAVVPLARDRPPVYRGDGGCDPVLHIPLRQQLRATLESINSKRQLYNDENIPGIEVHEGLDGRLYVLNPLGIVPPFMSSTGPAVPLRRLNHLLKQPAPEPFFPPPLSTYARDASSVHFHLSQILNERTTEARLEGLVKTLHANSLNICLLPMIAESILSTPKEDQEDYMRVLVNIICIEIVARTVRHIMFQEARLHYRPRIPLHQVNVYLARAVGTLVSGDSSAVFVDGLFPYIEERFVFDKTASKAAREELREALMLVVDSSAEAITMRLTRLCGLQMMRGIVGQVLVCPSSQNLHSLCVASLNDSTTYATRMCENSSSFVKEHFLRPLQVRNHIVNDRIDLAWETMRNLILDCTNDPNALFVSSHLWMVGALVAALAKDIRAAMVLINKARQVVETVPAYMVGAGEHHTVIPRYPFYVMGQVTVLTCSVYVLCLAKKYGEAERNGKAALRALDKLNSGSFEDLTSLRQEVMLAFMEVAAHAKNIDNVIRIDRLWLKEGKGGAFSPRAARISEILGSLFFENKMYSNAVERFADCLTITENLLGERSAAVAESLNKLAFAYYHWNVHTFGTLCSCLLHRAEDIMIAAYGRYSPLHLSVIENIIAVFIERGWFVAASIRLNTIQHLPARYAVRIPKDHPTMIRMKELKARISDDDDFQEVAVSIIEFAWIEYQSKHLLKGVWENSVTEIQRVGRAFITRRALLRLARGDQRSSIQYIARLQNLHFILSASKPLLLGGGLYCPWDHNWNGEYQQVRLFGSWSDSTEGTETLNALADVRNRFRKKAETVVKKAESGMLAGKKVPGCSTSFVYDNIVFTRIPKHSHLDGVQNDLFGFLSQELFIPVTTPVSTIISSDLCDYFAEALVPLRRQPELMFTSDGRIGPQGSESLKVLLSECVSQIRGEPSGGERTQGVELIRGADRVGYISNALGIVIDSSRSRQLSQSLSHSVSQLSHTLFYECIFHCIKDKPEKANDLLEQKILSLDAKSVITKSLYTALLSLTRLVARADDISDHQHMFDQIEDLNEAQASLTVFLIHYNYARILFRKDFPKDAMLYLYRVFRIMNRTRLHACYGAYIVLECASFFQVVAFACDRRIDDWVLKMVRDAIIHGEPTALLFTTCERFIMYHKRFEETALAEAFAQLRMTRAKEVPPYALDRITEDLVRTSEDPGARDVNERHKKGALCLSTALHLSKIHRENTKEFAVLLTRYGALLTTMNDLPAAKKTLHQAYSILSVVAPDSPEMIVWRNYSRTLKRRLRERAFDIIRRAVRGWRERRQAEADMRVSKPEEYKALQLVRLTRRLNRLAVAESTSRVLIAEAQTEDWYQLLRRQHRMRNDAMLRRTYGSRLRVYLDKLTSVGKDLMSLAEESKRSMAALFFEYNNAAQIDFFVKTHRLSRRVILAEWREERVKLKLWHVENIESVIRNQYMYSHTKFLAKCIDAEQNLWRSIIVSKQKQMKMQLGRYFNKKRAKPKKPHLEGRAIEIDEERQRDKLLDTEEEAFRLIMEGFTFGPEVYSEEDYDP